MTKVKLDTFNFDFGLESVSHTPGQGVTGMPDNVELLPADRGMQSYLDRVLSQPNLGSYLEEALRPRLTNRELLTRSRFRKTLGSAREQLKESGNAHPDEAALFKRAMRMMDSEIVLHDLLQMYISSLYAA